MPQPGSPACALGSLTRGYGQLGHRQGNRSPGPRLRLSAPPSQSYLADTRGAHTEIRMECKGPFVPDSEMPAIRGTGNGKAWTHEQDLPFNFRKAPMGPRTPHKGRAGCPLGHCPSGKSRVSGVRPSQIRPKRLYHDTGIVPYLICGVRAAIPKPPKKTKMRKAIFLFIAALGGSIVLASFAGAQGC